MICMKTGLPHDGDPCAGCVRVDSLAKLTREDPRVVASRAAVEEAWRAKQEGRELPLKERDGLDNAWRKLVEEDRTLFSEVWAEKAQEVDR